MIVFDLKCPQEHVFEAWFKDSETFEGQIEGSEIVCPVCGDSVVEKALMAPRIGKGDHEMTAKAAEHAKRYLNFALTESGQKGISEKTRHLEVAKQRDAGYRFSSTSNTVIHNASHDLHTDRPGRHGAA